jgi:hypothetical protein
MLIMQRLHENDLVGELPHPERWLCQVTMTGLPRSYGLSRCSTEA